MKAFEWIDLRARVRLLGFKLLLFDRIGAAKTDEAADDLYSEQEEARKALLRQLTPLVDSQKPPPQWTARRLWNTNRARLRRLWSTNWTRLSCLLKRARRDDEVVGTYKEEAMGGSSTGSRSSS